MARRQHKLSQSALALAVGVQRSAVSHWESPLGRNPTVTHLRTIAEATGVQFEWLATGRGTMALSREIQLDSVSAARALLIEDDLEMRMIQAFRSISLDSKVSLVEIGEQIAALRTGRSSKKLPHAIDGCHG